MASKQEGTSRQQFLVSSMPAVEQAQGDESSNKKQPREEAEAENGSGMHDRFPKKEFKGCFFSINETNILSAF